MTTSHDFIGRPRHSIVAAIGFAVALTLAFAGPVPAARAAGGARLWVSRYTRLGADEARAVAVSPDGARVFVTGDSFSDKTVGTDYATVAYDAATGDKVWAVRFDGSAQGYDHAAGLAVSPDGSAVYVTGTSEASGASSDCVTLAYDAATGALLWTSRYDDPQNLQDYATAIALSPSGASLFVTGHSRRLSTGYGFLTIGYDALTGQELWNHRYHSPMDADEYSFGLAVGPDGSRVYVTGYGFGSATGVDYLTVAYDAATGERAWVRRYDGPASSEDEARAVAASPDGSSVFVTGQSYGTMDVAFATVAYDATTGARLWTRRYHGPRKVAGAFDLAIGPDGTRVYVTGFVVGPEAGGYGTVAYDASTGARIWVRRYGSAGADYANAIDVSPDGARVYVAGPTQGSGVEYDYATVSFDAVTGDRLWLRRYAGRVNGDDRATALAVSPDGRVFVTGYSAGTQTDSDFATVAYGTN